MDFRPLSGDADPLKVAAVSFNARLLVLEEYPGNWVRVRTDDGREGYVDRRHLFLRPPEPEAYLYRTKPGDTALGIAQDNYRCGTWGQDGRFFVNVLVHVNGGQGDDRRGIYKEGPGGDWKTSKVRPNFWIWIPSDSFARSLAGVVSSGSITYELWQGVEGIIGFIVGIVDGFVSTLVGLVKGIIDLAGAVIDAIVSIIRNGIVDTIDSIKTLVAKLDPKAIATALWDGFVARWTAADAWERWRFRGEVVGTIVAEVLIALLSGGGTLAAKAAAKFGELGRLLRRVPGVEKAIAAVDRVADKVPGVKQLKDKLKAAQAARAAKAIPTPQQAAQLIRDATPVGSALKADKWHRAAVWAVDDVAANGTVFKIVGGDDVTRTLIQVPGGMEGVVGRFEWILEGSNLTHAMFVKGGTINGIPIRP